MKIIIQYKIKDELEQFMNLTPEEYFDPIAEDETFENDAIPKFDHAFEYLCVSKELLEWTEIEITEITQSKRIRTQFFDKGNSWMCQIKKIDGYEEIILSSQLNDSTVHIARIHKEESENWRVNYNGVFIDSKDGSQIEQRIC